jgi:hypothetical protein
MTSFAQPLVWTFIARARTGLMFDGDTADQEEARPWCRTTIEASRKLSMLLFILILTPWLVVLALIVAVCRTAADADGARDWSEKLSSAPIGPKLTLASSSRELRPPARRPHAQRALRRDTGARRARPAHVHH